MDRRNVEQPQNAGHTLCTFRQSYPTALPALNLATYGISVGT